VSGSVISWAICKSAPRSRQITTPAPHCSVFTGRMPFLPPNQQRQSTEGNIMINYSKSHSKKVCFPNSGCVRPLRQLYGYATVEIHGDCGTTDRADGKTGVSRRRRCSRRCVRCVDPLTPTQRRRRSTRTRAGSPLRAPHRHHAPAQLRLASLRGRLIEYQLRLG